MKTFSPLNVVAKQNTKCNSERVTIFAQFEIRQLIVAWFFIVHRQLSKNSQFQTEKT